MNLRGRAVVQWPVVRHKRSRLVLWPFYVLHFALMFWRMIYLRNHGQELGLS